MIALMKNYTTNKKKLQIKNYPQRLSGKDFVILSAPSLPLPTTSASGGLGEGDRWSPLST